MIHTIFFDHTHAPYSTYLQPKTRKGYNCRKLKRITTLPTGSQIIDKNCSQHPVELTHTPDKTANIADIPTQIH